MSVIVQNTEIFHLTVIQANTLRVGFRAPFLNHDGYIRIWRGLSVPYGNINSYIDSLLVGAQGTSDGSDLVCGGEDFDTGEYTIGYCTSSDPGSVCATVCLVDGQPAQQQATFLFLLAQYTNEINVFFMTLPGCNPHANGDEIFLYASTLQREWYNADQVARVSIPGENNAGNVQLQFPPGALVTGNSYTLYYHTGHAPGVGPWGTDQEGVCAGYQFFYFA